MHIAKLTCAIHYDIIKLSKLIKYIILEEVNCQ